MEGLGATLASLGRNCQNSGKLHLHFLCAELLKKDKCNIWHLLHEDGFEGRIQFIDFNEKQTFGKLRSLHGDWTTYGRLLIPEIIRSNIVLYLDSDHIETDILQFADIEFTTTLSAVKEGTVH